MTHRDQLRLAIEMQNGIVDEFVAARMAFIDRQRLPLMVTGRDGSPVPMVISDDNTLLYLWLGFRDSLNTGVYTRLPRISELDQLLMALQAEAEFWHEERFARRSAAS